MTRSLNLFIFYRNQQFFATTKKLNYALITAQSGSKFSVLHNSKKKKKVSYLPFNMVVAQKDSLQWRQGVQTNLEKSKGNNTVHRNLEM